MSRSYQHSPFVTMQIEHRRPLKRAAAKVIRRLSIDEDVGNGRVYCRYFPQYDIREYSSYVPSGRSRLFRKAGRYPTCFVPVTV